ncbi:MAG: hypothetical protein V4487_07340 [Chlamydiota bacterium]
MAIIPFQAPLVPNSYAPAVRFLPPPAKNWFQKVIASIGEFLLFCRPSFQAGRDMRTHFKGRIKIWETQNPQVVKAVQIMQRFLVGQKRGNLEGSYFEQLGISNRKLMDSVFLDLAVHMDPQEYLKAEKGRLERYRVQCLTQIGRDLVGKLSTDPQLSKKIQEQLIERSAQCTLLQLTELILELRAHLRCNRSKSVLHLEEISALMQMEPADLDRELLSHYLGSLEIQEKLTLQKLSKNALSKSEVRALEILTKRMGMGNSPLEPFEKRRLDRFFEAAAGNLELNQRLKKYAVAQHMTVSKAAIDLALDISFKLSQPEQFLEAINKVQRLEEKIALNQPTNPDERLSLGELKKVESLARLHEKFVQLEQIGAPLEHPLLLSADRANRFVNTILGHAEQERPHKGNSYIFYDFTNAVAYQKAAGGPFRAFFYRHFMPWPLTHAAAGIRLNFQNMVSHMWNGVHVLERRLIGDYAFKTFEFDFTKIIPEEGQALLRRKLGDDWIRRIEAIHEDITQQIHNNKELLSQITNPPIRWPFIALWFGFGSQNNRAQEHRELDKKQICSSLVLNLTLEAFERLEEHLKEVCNANLAPAEVPLSADYRFLKVPIHKNRLLNCVLPHQLPKIIFPLVREVEKPAIIRQVLNFHEFAMS